MATPIKNERLEAEKAEFVQSVKALFIPGSLFLACIIIAAGIFLIYNSEPLGWAFVAVGVTAIVAAFIALIRFQNKLRARGILVLEDEEKVPITTNHSTAAMPPDMVRLANSIDDREAG